MKPPSDCSPRCARARPANGPLVQPTPWSNLSFRNSSRQNRSAMFPLGAEVSLRLSLISRILPHPVSDFGNRLQPNELQPPVSREVFRKRRDSCKLLQRDHTSSTTTLRGHPTLPFKVRGGRHGPCSPLSAVCDASTGAAGCELDDESA